MDEFNFSQHNLKDLIEGIFYSFISPFNLPKNLYIALSEYLLKGVYKGFGKSLGQIEFGTPDYRMLEELQTNIYLFSAAKTFQQTLEMSDALVDEKGELLSLEEFRQVATDIFAKYNGYEEPDGQQLKGWLDTERNTAITQAGNTAKWMDIEKKKDVLPYLQYVSAGDELVCDICDPFDGICLPVDDPFWSEYAPANHFNCRCLLEQLDQEDGEDEESEDEEVEAAKEESEIQDEFKYNPGKSGEIFSTEGQSQHPYFSVPKEYEEFAKANFGLPLSVPEESVPRLEIQDQLRGLIADNLDVDVKSVIFNPNITNEQLSEYKQQIQKLFEDYEPAKIYSSRSNVEVKLASTGDYYGRIVTSNQGTFLDEINFGHKFDKSRSETHDIEKRVESGLPKLWAKSHVDEKNLPLATVTHEFAHLITTRIQNKAGSKDKRIGLFWDEISSLKRKYTSEINKLSSEDDIKSLQSVYLGNYGSTEKTDEFMAEGFTEYRLSNHPSKYATAIGKLVDKYFGRE